TSSATSLFGVQHLGSTGNRPAHGERIFKPSFEQLNPLLGGAEAEGFGVGVRHEEPTPALRATPPKTPKRGFAGRHQTHRQKSGSISP
ncbi:MAG: hypothetical protein ACRD2L_00355, partial [Terriglobia bacterium]